MGKITYINGMRLMATIPAQCIRCGSEEFELEDNETGTDACCKKCHLLHMAFEKHLSRLPDRKEVMV